MNEERAYRDILNVLNKHIDVVKADSAIDITLLLETRLFVLELNSKYGLNVNPLFIRNKEYIKINEYLSITLYGEKYRRTISWLDDGEQPEDEYLLSIQFPTGAYIFGRHYDKGLFNKFFNQLKTYNPDYSDSHNHCLYFKLNNARDIYYAFPEILQKYKEQAADSAKQMKIEALKKELSSLEDL